jgi:uncharacterized protein (TIGR00369 family)
MPACPPSFDQFDPHVADTLVKANNDAQSGLPHYLGIQIIELSAGRLTARLPVRNDLLTPFGAIHGGVMAAFVDHVLGCVLYPLIGQGQWAATTEFKLNYLTAVRKGELVAESTVLAMTKRTAVIRVEVTNEGRPACVAQGTLLVADPTAT